MSGALKHLKMSQIDRNLLQSKFRGSMLGALLGDCFGGPYEGDQITSGEKIIIQRYFDELESPDLKAPLRPYSDDTAMLTSVAQSLVDRPEAPDHRHLAKLFVKEYYSNPKRGYGQNVVDVFHKLRRDKWTDVYAPAAQQFSGTGSYGNGGAMRIAPVALHFHDRYDVMVDVAQQVTRITHTNPLGVHGALLQCIAVHKALVSDAKTAPIDTREFCEYLIDKIRVFENDNDDDGLGLDDLTPYQDKIKIIQELLQLKPDKIDDDEVIKRLGNSISAIDSVPTAIFCFLRSLDNIIPTVKTDNVFRRSIQYAITLGGDTDTIACMAGSIAGAYLGEAALNSSMIKQCEFHEEILNLADKLHQCTDKK